MPWVGGSGFPPACRKDRKPPGPFIAAIGSQQMHVIGNRDRRQSAFHLHCLDGGRELIFGRADVGVLLLPASLTGSLAPKRRRFQSGHDRAACAPARGHGPLRTSACAVRSWRARRPLSDRPCSCSPCGREAGRQRQRAEQQPVKMFHRSTRGETKSTARTRRRRTNITRRMASTGTDRNMPSTPAI